MNFTPESTFTEIKTPPNEADLLRSQLAEMSEKMRQLSTENAQLKVENAQLERISYLDSLTEIPNRRFINSELAQNIAEVDRGLLDLFVAEIDVDYFKKVNDTYGHSQGDEVLKNFAKLLKKSIRDSDTCGRWGGEEFILIMPVRKGILKEEIESFLKKLQDEAAQINRSNNPYQHESLTISIGTVLLKSNDLQSSEIRKQTDQEDVFRQVDEALYESKQAGRNTYTIKEFQEGYLKLP